MGVQAVLEAYCGTDFGPVVPSYRSRRDVLLGCWIGARVFSGLPAWFSWAQTYPL
jgi:hypothetical protein